MTGPARMGDRPPGRAFLVTGTDTGVGKTYVACLLGKRLGESGYDVRPVKPVESGCPPGRDGRPHPADAAALRDAMAPGLPLSDVCPYPFAAPLSPHLAARREGIAFDPARVGRVVAAARAASDVVLVEGAGGIAVEMGDGYAAADLARDLGLPALVVAGNRLGVLNHLKLTLAFLASGGVDVAGVVLNDAYPGDDPSRDPNEAEVGRIAGGLFLGRVRHGASSLPGDLAERFLAALR